MSFSPLLASSGACKTKSPEEFIQLALQTKLLSIDLVTSSQVWDQLPAW